MKIQHERPRGEFAERDLLPVALHESHHHWFKTALNLFRGHLGLQTGFCWKQFAQMTEQGPQRGFNRSAVNFVLLELARTKKTRPGSVPSPVTRAQEPLNNGRGQAVLRNSKTNVNFAASDPRADGSAEPEPIPEH